MKKKTRINMHQIVFFTFCGEKVLLWMHHGNIDHINHNKADNRLANQ
jgi:hypothetical protein